MLATQREPDPPDGVDMQGRPVNGWKKGYRTAMVLPDGGRGFFETSTAAGRMATEAMLKLVMTDPSDIGDAWAWFSCTGTCDVPGKMGSTIVPVMVLDGFGMPPGVATSAAPPPPKERDTETGDGTVASETMPETTAKLTAYNTSKAARTVPTVATEPDACNGNGGRDPEAGQGEARQQQQASQEADRAGSQHDPQR
jgi:hypothetical protein